MDVGGDDDDDYDDDDDVYRWCRWCYREEINVCDVRAEVGSTSLGKNIRRSFREKTENTWKHNFKFPDVMSSSPNGMDESEFTKDLQERLQRATFRCWCSSARLPDPMVWQILTVNSWGSCCDDTQVLISLPMW